MDVTVTGAERLAKLSRQLKEAGDKGLKRELAKGIRASTKPLIADVRVAAVQKLPTRGGLGERVAASKISTRTTTAGRNVGVRLVGKSGYDLKKIDAGKVRHPVFGGRSWVSQDVPSGFWTGTLKAGAPKVRKEIVKAMRRVARQVGR